MTIEETFQSFTEISIEQVEELMTAKHFVLFVGRLSCSYCRTFAPKLQQAAQDTKREVYYLDSDNLAHFEEIQAFRSHFGMTTVPALLVKKSDQIQVICQSSLALEKIKEVLSI